MSRFRARRWFEPALPALLACVAACAGSAQRDAHGEVAARAVSADELGAAPERAAPPQKSKHTAAKDAPPSAASVAANGAGDAAFKGPARSAESDASARVSRAKRAEPESANAAGGANRACPSGMLRVQFDYCPKVTRRCLDQEYDKPNQITICHKYAPEKPECEAEREPLDFCIDEYEYPNRAGAKPPVMVNFFEARAMCGAEQKRLCYEREWVAACEGPDEKPFPYGYERSNRMCNFDNRWVDPHLSLVYAKDAELQKKELARLDRSVPSGQMAGCVSDFGVHDLTGNVDEWALADHERPRAKAKFSALKGGAWGHVRNACRPVTTSHVPQFRYYFIGFRCCRDVVK